jgi:hypothetical protein
MYNLVALRLPVAAHPSEMRLHAVGLRGRSQGLSDQIYTINTATKSPLSGSTIYCDGDGVWRFVKDQRRRGAVGLLQAQRRDRDRLAQRMWATGSWTWTYHPGHFYTLPTRWMGWADTPPPPVLGPGADDEWGRPDLL